MLISGNTTGIKREAEKILKHKDLTIGAQRTWNIKAKVTQVIIRAKGKFSKSFRHYLLTYLLTYSVVQIPS